MTTAILPTRIYLKTFGALLALLLLTVGAACVNLGPLNLGIALAISIAKTLLIVLFFMHMRGGGKLLHLAAFAGVLWFGIMIALTLCDYTSRSWVPLTHR